jgi:glycosyltransferase involved in cell wall biosynthesis
VSAASLRVLALVPYPPGRVPGQRYRIEQWLPHLLREGVEVQLEPYLGPDALARLHAPGRTLAKARDVLGGGLRRLARVARLSGYDVAYVYREATLLGTSLVERRLARRVPFVLDFDDAIYLSAVSPANAAFAWLKRPGKTAELCRLARHVVVGNETLAAYARPLAREVSVVPSTIDTELYVPGAAPPGARPIVGWTGSATTLPYLEALAPALRRLRARVDFELRVIGGAPRLDGLDVVARPWRAESEVLDLRPLDVGLMPLPDDPWARGKCGMKALQYMALAIPPLVSPVGVNAQIVTHGVNGFHAAREDDWVERGAELLGDAGLRARLGAAARRTVEEGYSARVHAPRLAALLRAAAS